MSKLAEFLKSTHPAANHANPANHDAGISNISGFSALEDGIRQMAARWQYSELELANALNRAAQNPAGWLMCVEDDESKQLWKV